jgi:hypothetical protein
MTSDLNEKVDNDEKSPNEGADTPSNTVLDEKDPLEHEPGDSGVTRNSVKLHPQPTTDPLDPLNWTSLQKHSILGIVMFK